MFETSICRELFSELVSILSRIVYKCAGKRCVRGDDILPMISLVETGHTTR